MMPEQHEGCNINRIRGQPNHPHGERIGRKAREQTQVELAERLGINQASVSAIENNSDLLLSTLAKYVRALGGELQLQAVFPEATFNLAPPEMAMAAVVPMRRVRAKRTAVKKTGAGRVKAVAS
jgi:transcriptional regulator with XRE-family HTH domain